MIIFSLPITNGGGGSRNGMVGGGGGGAKDYVHASDTMSTRK